MTRNQQILAELERLYPNAGPELHFTNPFETLIATMLSAQCTDKQVNKVTEKLFARFQTPAQLAALTPEELEPWIKGCGVYHNKAKNIVNCCRILCERYGGEVPADWEALQTLPGVGRKTANVVYANAFGGDCIAVDTHVFRVSNRLGLANAKNVLQDRAAIAGGHPQIRLVQGPPLDHLPWPSRLPRAQSQMRRLYAAPSVRPSPGRFRYIPKRGGTTPCGLIDR